MTEDEFAELRSKVEELEYKLEMFMELVDSEQNPFAYMVIELKLTREQVGQIYDLMDRWQDLIDNNTPNLNHHQFEQEVYQIVPSHYGDYHFAESIVSTLYQNQRWTDVYTFMKENGMNI